MVFHGGDKKGIVTLRDQPFRKPIPIDDALVLDVRDGTRRLNRLRSEQPSGEDLDRAKPAKQEALPLSKTWFIQDAFKVG